MQFSRRYTQLKYPKISGFTIVEEIGGGGFSTVYRAANREAGTVAAVKVVLLTAQTTELERKALEREMRIHGALDHTNILHFMDAVVVDGTTQTQYIPAVYMLLELAAGGDLFDKIVPDVGIDADLAQHYFGQLVAGVDHIHKQGVAHRDLKPENILLDAGGVLKISDFGLGAVWMIKDTGKTRQLNDVCGSLPYIAPELNLGQPYEAPPIDIWGLGIILFTLLVGNTPWDEPTVRSPEYASFLRKEIFQHSPWNRIGGPELSLIVGLLTVEPTKRMTFDEIYAHPWMSRPSQFAGKGTALLAEQLTSNLRAAGDLALAAPPDEGGSSSDEDDDVYMRTAPPHFSQFTQTLMLFSQTQGGRRYTPHLTRFYAAAPPTQLRECIVGALGALGVKHKDAPPAEAAAYADDAGADDAGEAGTAGTGALRLRVGGLDARRETFKGWVEIEPYVHRRGGDGAQGAQGSFCVLRREVGNPISWRQLWKALVQYPDVEPLVYRRRS